MIWLYRLFWLMVLPIAAVYILIRLLNGKEDGLRFKERLGFASAPKSIKPIIWLHGASVGETLSILPLIDKLKTQDIQLLVTSGTRTSAQLAQKRLPEGVIHQYIPLDLWPCIKLFMCHWNPSVCVFVESEFWPEILTQAPQVILINGRLSDRSFKRMSALKPLLKSFFKKYAAVLTQGETDTQKFTALGIQNVQTVGNIKFDAPALPVDVGEFNSIKAHMNRPVLTVASTHDPEEVVFIDMYPALKAAIPNLLMILVPRHPHRGPQIDRLCEHAGISFTRRSVNPDISGDIYIADTLGEMGLWLKLCDVCFMGGTIAPIGGHNFLEPLQFRKPTICGPHTHLQEMTHTLKQQQLLIQCDNSETINERIIQLLHDPSYCETYASNISHKLSDMCGATDAAFNVIKSRL